MTNEVATEPPSGTGRGVADDRLRELARASHRVIAREQAPSGAYPACSTFSAYRGYSWLRDGAFIAEGMSRYGDAASADRFHDWVAGVLAARRPTVDDLVRRSRAGEQLAPEEMLPTRFDLTDSGAPDTWWNFQTDGYGTWLWAVMTHASRHGRDVTRWAAGIGTAVDYVTEFWGTACYDWWEEHREHQHVSTLGALYGGLTAAGAAEVLGETRAAAARAAAAAVRDTILTAGVHRRPGRSHLVKWVGSTAIDASLASCIVPFGVLKPRAECADGTLDEIRDHLDVGTGVHRFPQDVFYGGGQWLLLTALLGWNEAAAGDRASARRRLEWVAEHADADGRMPEQVPDHLLHPDERDVWLDRWGPVASPLLWSHGMYLILADELDLLPSVDAR